MLAQLAYSAAFGGEVKPEDKVQKVSNQQQSSHKLYDEADDLSQQAPSLNV